jgi:uncharacterized membrane protein
MENEDRPESGPSQASIANVRAISRLEAEASEKRSRAERVADVIASFVGTLWFLGLQMAICGVWIALNIGVVAGAAFDPYPFAFLALIVSLEAVVISVFVLIKQNRMGRRADERAHLSLQFGMLAEQESTKSLALLEKIAQRLGIDADDPLIADLRRETKLEHLASVMRRSLTQP